MLLMHGVTMEFNSCVPFKSYKENYFIYRVKIRLSPIQCLLTIMQQMLTLKYKCALIFKYV